MQRFITNRPAHQPDCLSERPSNRFPICPFSQDCVCPAPQRPGENSEHLWGETLNASLSLSIIHPSIPRRAEKPENFHCLFHINTSLEVSIPERDRNMNTLCWNMFKHPVCIIREGCQSVPAAKTSPALLALPDIHYLLKGHYFTAYR